MKLKIILKYPILLFKNIPSDIKNKVVLVSDQIFSIIVNDNLEVRTSNSIDPATGAAEDKALYSYEAIPRSTIFWFPVTYNKPELFRIKGIMPGKSEDIKHFTKEDIKNFVHNGFELIEYLGIGGMSTRGMGRDESVEY